MRALLQRFDSLMLRLLIVQVFVIVAVFATMIFSVAQYRSAATARMVAPLWADAVRAAATPSAQPEQRHAITPIRLLPGPPPAAAREANALRHDALREEMAAQGVRVDEIRVSGQPRPSVIWLQVQKAGVSQWVGVQSDMFGASYAEGLPRGLILLVALTLVIASSWWISRTVVRPVKQLEDGIQRFFGNADEIPAIPETGPAEVRALSRSFLKVAGERAMLDRDRALMLASISHDLRSPLARIRLAADFIPADCPEPALRETIKRNVDIADRHLESFMAFAIPPNFSDRSSIDVQMLLDDVVYSAVPDASCVQVNVESGARHFPSNAALLQRIVITGLDNAVKHGASPIEIRALRAGDSMVFEIEDAGSGLAPEERERVLRPFERGERARTTPGTGLGLSIAARIAQRLGGRVELIQRSQGLVFRCIFPSTGQKPQGTN
jgi:two-component system, OmpR family, osmolarity sensor histidine kinase EnvZ